MNEMLHVDEDKASTAMLAVLFSGEHGTLENSYLKQPLGKWPELHSDRAISSLVFRGMGQHLLQSCYDYTSCEDIFSGANVLTPQRNALTQKLKVQYAVDMLPMQEWEVRSST